MTDRSPRDARLALIEIAQEAVARSRWMYGNEAAVISVTAILAHADEVLAALGLTEEECCASCGGLIKRVGSAVICRGTYCYGPQPPKVKRRFVSEWRAVEPEEVKP